MSYLDSELEETRPFTALELWQAENPGYKTGYSWGLAGDLSSFCREEMKLDAESVELIMDFDELYPELHCGLEPDHEGLHEDPQTGLEWRHLRTPERV